MDKPDAGPVEENMALLMQATLGPEARPAAGLRRSMLRRLLRESARSAPVVFPDAVVVLLGGLWLLAAAVLAMLLALGASPLAANPALLLPAAGLALNLVLVPVAGVVIVRGRKND